MKSGLFVTLARLLAVTMLASVSVAQEQPQRLPIDIFTTDFGLMPRSSMHGEASGALGRRGLQSGALPHPPDVWEQAVYVEWETSAENDGVSPRTTWWSEQQVRLVPELAAKALHLWRYETQRFDVEYRVTAVCALEDDGLLVAGIDATGATVLEEWRLEWPERMPEPAPSGIGDSTLVEVVFPELAFARRIPMDAEVVRGGVRGMIELERPRELGQAVLVQLRSSYDVLRVELANGTHAPVAVARSPAIDGIAIPALASTARRFTRRERRPDGSVAYFLEENRWACSRVAPYIGYVELIDHQGDGRIDDHAVRRPCDR